MAPQDSLPPGYRLIEEYRIQKLLGSGGFANTYLARDIALDRNVAIKEYFPRDFAVRAQGASVSARSSHQQKDFLWGLDRFAREARIISRLKHPNIVRVYRVFNALNTAYIVLEFVDGADLEVTLSKRRSSPLQADVDQFLGGILDALAVVHAEKILHRDVKPANIFIRRADGAPVLLDFGASKIAVAEASGTTAAIVSRGYSPQEAYATDAKLQGPWTDIYSLAATLYLMIAGRTPPEATERVLCDTLLPAVALGVSGYRESFLAAIDWGLRVQPNQRPRSVEEWRPALLNGARPAPPAAKVGPKFWWRSGFPFDRRDARRASQALVVPSVPADHIGNPGAVNTSGRSSPAGSGASAIATNQQSVRLSQLPGSTYLAQPHSTRVPPPSQVAALNRQQPIAAPSASQVAPVLATSMQHSALTASAPLQAMAGLALRTANSTTLGVGVEVKSATQTPMHVRLGAMPNERRVAFGLALMSLLLLSITAGVWYHTQPAARQDGASSVQPPRPDAYVDHSRESLPVPRRLWRSPAPSYARDPPQPSEPSAPRPSGRVASDSDSPPPRASTRAERPTRERSSSSDMAPRASNSGSSPSARSPAPISIPH